MINRKHIDHAELLELGKLLLLLTKRQQIELNLSTDRNQRMTEVERLARASSSRLLCCGNPADVYRLLVQLQFITAGSLYEPGNPLTTLMDFF
jgi:hypothetical protein